MSDQGTDPIDGQAGEDADRPVRRNKSAHLMLDAKSSDVASLREAMDPANASLGEALRLSYRLLQVAILGLVATFLFSGFQQVPEGVAGIRTIFGRVAGKEGEESLAPGLHPFWPYPVGEFHTLPQRRSIELGNAFFPAFPQADMTIEQATDSADENNPIRPGKDGSLITADGDLVHVRVNAEFTVVDPVKLLAHAGTERIDAIMRMLLRHSVVQVVAQYTLAELLEQRDTPEADIRRMTQAAADRLQMGVEVVSVSLPERTAPLAIRNALRRVQAAREDSKTAIERARQDANGKLVGAAGPNYPAVLSMIADYEQRLTAGDNAGADALLAEIGGRLEQPDIGGAAAMIVARARAYQSALEAALGKETQRLQSLSASYRENPKQLVQKLWLDAVREIVSRKESEIFSVPPGLGRYVIRIKSSPDVMQARRDAEIARKKHAAEMIGFGLPSFQLGSRQIMIDRAGRRLDASGEKGFGRE